MDPSTLAYGSLYGQAAGGIMSAIGAFMGASAQRASLRGQAEVAEINAQTAERAAQAAMLAGQHDEQRSMLQTAALKSTQRASMAANGIDLGEGSAARVLTSTDAMGKIDANTIAANAVRQAWGYRTTATNYSNEALTKRAGADSISPVVSGGASLLSSAGTVAQNWYLLDKAGALDNGTKRYGRGDL